MSPILDTLYTTRGYLRAMLVGGLLLTACLATRTVSVVGAPVKREEPVNNNKRDEPTSTIRSTTTRTTTVTIAYKPTLVPGDVKYDLLGCYGQSGLDGAGGHPFGKESDFASPSSVNTTELTVYSCLQGCFALSPPKGGSADHFKYTGMKNGSECYCGMTIASGAEKLDAKNCSTPCSGDPKLSCGGIENLVVYSYVPDAQKAVASTDATPTPSGDKNEPKPNNGLPPTTTAASDDTASSPSSPVGAVAGSVSGVLVLAAIFFFCFRFQRKKKALQDAHVDAILSKHQDSTAVQQQQPLGILATNANVHDDLHLTVTGDMLPSTPLLEKGAKQHQQNLSPMPGHMGATGEYPAQDRDSLYTTLMSDTGTTPVPVVPTEGNSSAVQWRTIDHGGSGVPSSPRIASPPPPFSTSGMTHGLGNAPWAHRRRLSSTPYGAPPTAPLPPDPPHHLLSRGPGPATRGGRGGAMTPQRPPRRGSVATFEVGTRETPLQSPSSTTSFASLSTEGMRPTPPLKLQRPGAGPGLNVQTRQLGRGGRSLTTGNNRGTVGIGAATGEETHQQQQQPQPTLPKLPPVPRPETMNFDSPILPPLQAGERFNFDSRAWKDLPSPPMRQGAAGSRVPVVAAPPKSSREEDTRMQRNVNEDGVSPASASTVGSSILGSPTIMDWAGR
ncbi:hypothetical protein E8E14_009875 [Neopestalotiopsis sp. 37M]|nr:hypothetical protein E8E14_009875 [Neopestalotiopsis sp. 37M]